MRRASHMLLAATAVAAAAAASAVSRPLLPVMNALHHIGTSPALRSASLPTCPTDASQADYVFLRGGPSKISAKQAMRVGVASAQLASLSASRFSRDGCRMSFTLPADTRLLAAGVGGTLAGSLHAVTGPDHLAALLPMSIGQRWWKAIYAGAYWGSMLDFSAQFSKAVIHVSGVAAGLGHGIGAALVGALAFVIRGAFNLEVLCTYMEAAVGISIMVIGGNGIREANEWMSTDWDSADADAAAAATRGELNWAEARARNPSVLSTLGTGILHGCSGSGHLLGVMPALAMPSWPCAATYLSAFGIGTMLAMSVFTALVGEASAQMGARLKDRDVPAKLSLASSVFALAMGTVWTVKASLALGLPRQAMRAAVMLTARLGLAR